MALQLVITDAGRAEIINAQNSGTDPVLISEIGFGTGQYTAAATQTALVSETKRLSTISGEVVADDTIHVSVQDETGDAYDVGEIGLFTDSGTLFAVYSQPSGSGWIIQKNAASTLLLASDIVLDTLDAASVTFGDTSFSNPPATETVKGVVELATPQETADGLDSTRVPPPSALKPLWGQMSDSFTINAPIDLTAAHLNKFFPVINADPITLPPSADVRPGSTLGFVNGGVAPVTIRCHGTDTIAVKSTGITEFTLENGDFCRLVMSDQNKWRVISGSSLLANSGAFLADRSAAGYQKLPGGLIMQWGTIGFSSGIASVTFPIAFPNQVFVVVPGDASAPGALFYVGADSPSVTGFTARSSNSGDSGAARYIAIGI